MAGSKMSVEEAVELLHLEVGVTESEIAEARELLLSQADPVYLVFGNCDVGENGYENGIMGLAKDLVSDDESVISDIMRAYDEADPLRRYYLRYCAVDGADDELGSRLLEGFGVSREQYEYDMLCWDVRFYGDGSDVDFLFNDEDGHYYPDPKRIEFNNSPRGKLLAKARKRILEQGLDYGLQTMEFIESIVEAIKQEEE